MNKRIKAIALAGCVASLSLVGCQTIDPYTGTAKTSNAAKGAGIGAIGGALIGAATGDSDDALRGALIGAAAGGGVGYYMDRQEVLLRQRLEGTGVSVTRIGDNILLNMPGNITFATNSSAIAPSMQQTLDSVALVLEEFKDTRIEVGGHTDSTGSDSHNLLLSKDRANSVADHLARQGVDWRRFAINGYGETRPVATNDTAQGRSANRRVELTLQPLRG